MKKLLFILMVGLTLMGCEKYELETFPTLDGTYRVSSVTMTVIGGETTHYINSGEEVWFASVDGPLEEIIIDETRFHISGKTFYAGYRQDDWGSDWMFNYNIKYQSDFITGSWNRITLTDYSYSRTFNIMEDGLEYIKMNRPAQYVETDNGTIEVEYSMTLYREGP